MTPGQQIIREIEHRDHYPQLTYQASAKLRFWYGAFFGATLVIILQLLLR